MDKKPLGTAFWILATFALGLALLIVAGLVLSSGVKPTQPTDDPAAVKNYYTQLKELNSTVSRAFHGAMDKAANGDVKGAYADFKSTAGDKIDGATALLYELKLKAPEVPDKKLLTDTADKFLVSFNKRQDAVKLFIEGVENSLPGKFSDAKVASQKADDYLVEANALLTEIASKHGLNK